MPGNGQHRALGGIGGQLAAVPANGFAGVVAIAYLHRQTAQVQLLAAGVGQLGGLGLDGNAADLFFGGGNRHACADGFRIVGGGLHLCEEVVGGVGVQTREYTLRLPVCGGFICDVVAVSNCCTGIVGFYHSLIQSNLRRADRLPGQRDLIRSRAYLHCKVLLYRVIVAATIFVVSSREGVLSHIANRSFGSIPSPSDRQRYILQCAAIDSSQTGRCGRLRRCLADGKFLRFCAGIVAFTGGGHCDRSGIGEVSVPAVAVGIGEGVVCACTQGLTVQRHRHSGIFGGSVIGKRPAADLHLGVVQRGQSDGEFPAG